MPAGGDTQEEALADIAEAIPLCLEVRAERGLPLSIETRQIEVAACSGQVPANH